MEQLDLQALLAKSYDVCDAIEAADVGNVHSDVGSLKDRLRLDLARFGEYVADGDGKGGSEETEFIRTTLGYSEDAKPIQDMRNHARVDASFSESVPQSLKYAVLSDAGSKLQPDPFGRQSSMYFYDTFAVFGQTVLAMRAKDVSHEAVQRYTSYIERVEQLLKEYAVWRVGTQKTYRAVEPPASPQMEGERAQKLEELLADLNSLIGLEAVKRQVRNMVNLIKVQNMRQEAGMKTADVSKHMVFMGNPGTGKTTVARKLAEIYKYLGVLRKGQLVEVDRSGLVRGYVGQTATQTQEVVEESLGGLLFVDEAYALTVGKGEGDFGQEAVDTLLKAMEDNRDDLVVIVAGYTDLMGQFLESNPGLRSRFSNFVYFDDYTADELMQILEQNLAHEEYRLSPDAAQAAREMIERRVAAKPANFANARDIRNFMEHAIENHATRVADLADARSNKAILGTLEVEDLEDWS